MESPEDGNLDVHQPDVESNNALVVPVLVPVDEDVNQLVVRYEDSGAPNDQTTYIIQFVDSTDSTEPQTGVTGENSHTGNEDQGSNAATEKDPGIQNLQQEPGNLAEKTSKAKQVKHKKGVPQDLQKALKLEPSESTQITETNEHENKNQENLTDDGEQIFESLENESEQNRKTNRRNIKKPKRFSDPVEKSQGKAKYIRLPKVTTKSLGLQDLCIEVEIEENLFVSALEKSDGANGVCKYSFRVSKSSLTRQSSLKDEMSKSSEEYDSNEPVSEPVSKRRSSGRQKVIIDSEKVSSIVRKGRKKKTEIPDPKEKLKKRQKLDISDETVDVKTDVVKDDEESEKNLTPVNEISSEKKEVENPLISLDNIVKSEGILTAESEQSDPSSREGSQNKKQKQGSQKGKAKRKSKKEKEEEVDEEEEKEEDGDKAKRKYTKRNAYNRDDRNYTVRKSETGRKYFVCSICGRECISAANIKDHLCVHTDQRPVSCEDCGMSFKSEKALKRHAVRHSEKSFICDSCGALFCSSSDLKSHSSVHANKREFVCSDCGKGFNHSTTLSRHKQVHKEERNKHVCYICGATFRRKDGVRRHVINIHGVEDKAENARPSVKQWFRNERLSDSLKDAKNTTSSEANKTTEEKDGRTAELIPHMSDQTETYWTPYTPNACQSDTLHYYKTGNNTVHTDSEQRYTDISKNNHSYLAGNPPVSTDLQLAGTLYATHMERGDVLQETSGVYVSSDGQHQFLDPQRQESVVNISNSDGVQQQFLDPQRQDIAVNVSTTNDMDRNTGETSHIMKFFYQNNCVL